MNTSRTNHSADGYCAHHSSRSSRKQSFMGPLASCFRVCHLQNCRGIGARMFLQTVEQVRRIFRVLAGFTLLAVGVVMLVTPGPGWLAIFLGLGLLAAEFVWARRLMDRIKGEGNRIKGTVLGRPEPPISKSDEPPRPAAPNAASGEQMPS